MVHTTANLSEVKASPGSSSKGGAMVGSETAVAAAVHESEGAVRERSGGTGE